MKKNFNNTDYISDSMYYALANFLTRHTKPVIKSKSFEIKDNKDYMSIKFNRNYMTKEMKNEIKDNTVDIKGQIDDYIQRSSELKIVNYFYRGVKINIVFNQLGNIKINFEYKNKNYNIDVEDRDILNIIHIVEINVNMAIQELSND